MADRPVIHVMAGVLSDAQGRVLVAQRPVGKHLAGRWEFPGGKLAEDEAPLAGLKRELSEELGIKLRAAEPLIRLRHDYQDRSVLLDVWRVTRYTGTPSGLDAQALDWVAPDGLPDIDLLEADRPIVTALRLCPVARCVDGLEALVAATSGGNGPETLFWRPAGADALEKPAREAVRAAQRAGHRVLVAGDSVAAATIAAVTGADGMLLQPTGEPLRLDPNVAFLTGALCPTPETAQAAVRSGAHFLVLVPGGDPANGRQFAALFQHLGVPAYIGWYPDAESLELARASGAHGCAIGPFADRGG